jgi:hypothetical protein
MFFELSRDATGFQYKTDFSIPLSTLSWNVMSCHTMFRGKGVIKNPYFNLKTNVKNSDGNYYKPYLNLNANVKNSDGFLSLNSPVVFLKPIPSFFNEIKPIWAR